MREACSVRRHRYLYGAGAKHMAQPKGHESVQELGSGKEIRGNPSLKSIALSRYAPCNSVLAIIRIKSLKK